LLCDNTPVAVAQPVPRANVGAAFDPSNKKPAASAASRQGYSQSASFDTVKSTNTKIDPKEIDAGDLNQRIAAMKANLQAQKDASTMAQEAKPIPKKIDTSFFAGMNEATQSSPPPKRAAPAPAPQRSAPRYQDEDEDDGPPPVPSGGQMKRGGPPPPPSGGGGPKRGGGPPPPPATNNSRPPKPEGMPSGAPSELLSSIEGFSKRGLRRVQCNDRSAPVVGRSKDEDGGPMSPSRGGGRGGPQAGFGMINMAALRGGLRKT